MAKAINNDAPKYEIKQRCSPWIDGECLHLIHLKKEAWNKAKRSNSNYDWDNYKLLITINANRLLITNITNTYNPLLTI